MVGVAAIDIVAKVSKFPQPDELVVADGINFYPGGSGANTAVAISQLGGSVGFIGKVGRDDHGEKIIADLEKNNIDISSIVVSKDQETASCFISVNERGERIIFALGGAIIDSLNDLNVPMIQNAKGLCLSDIDGDLLRFAGETAHQGGAKVFYNPGGNIISRGIENLASVMDEIDVLIINKSEANILNPNHDDHDLIKSLIKRENSIIIKTLGAEGAALLSLTETFHVPAVPAAAVVDSTGAGDAFVAGLIASYLQGETRKQAVSRGCEVASVKLGFPGARAEYPQNLIPQSKR